MHARKDLYFSEKVQVFQSVQARVCLYLYFLREKKCKNMLIPKSQTHINVALLGNEGAFFRSNIQIRNQSFPKSQVFTSNLSVMWLKCWIFCFQESNVSYFPNGLGEGKGHDTDVVKACLGYESFRMAPMGICMRSCVHAFACVL